MRKKANDSRPDKSIAQYLRGIDKGPLLTKDEEQVLVKKVELIQNQIIETCLLNSYSKHELKIYLAGIDIIENEKVISLSRRLEEFSTKDQIDDVRTKFKQLIREFDKPNTILLTALLEDIVFSGTIVHGVIQEVKRKFNLVNDIESKVKQYGKLFDVFTIDEIQERVTKIKSDDEFRKKQCKDYGITELRILNKCREFDEIKVMYTQIESQLPKPITFHDVKTIYKTINLYEFQMKQSRDLLVTKNLRLVISRAKKQMNKGLDIEDLIQEGNIGLMKAIDKFDSSRNTKIGTYATWWIDQSIKRAISNKGKTVRIPTHIEWMQTKLTQHFHILSGKLQRDPTITELSVASGYTIEQIQEVKTTAQHEVWIDDVNASGLSFADILPTDSPNPDTIVDEQMRREGVRKALAELTPRSEMIIRLRYGIGELPDQEGQTLQEIAGQVNLTKQGVRLNECKALVSLKKQLKSFKHDLKEG